MYIQPTSEDGAPAVQLPRDYAGTAFSPQPAIEQAEVEQVETEPSAPQESPAEAAPAFSPQRPSCGTGKGKGSLFSFLTNSPLLSSFLPPARKGHEGENDIMQWILVGAVILLLLNDSDDDILPLLLLLLFWK